VRTTLLISSFLCGHWEAFKSSGASNISSHFGMIKRFEDMVASFAMIGFLPMSPKKKKKLKQQTLDLDSKEV